MRSRQIVFYHLGEGCSIRPDGTPLWSWPYEVSYAPHYLPGELYLAEGDGRNGNGGFFPPAVVLTKTWRAHLEITQTLWLLPLLERMASGEKVEPSEILEAYQQQHGRPAPREEKALYGVD